MTTTISSTDIVVSTEPLFTGAERSALAGFLAGYSGLTRDAYALDLRMYTAWCQQHGLHLFQGRRSDIRCFGRDMEQRGRARPGWAMDGSALREQDRAPRRPPRGCRRAHRTSVGRVVDAALHAGGDHGVAIRDGLEGGWTRRELGSGRRPGSGSWVCNDTAPGARSNSKVCTMPPGDGSP